MTIWIKMNDLCCLHKQYIRDKQVHHYLCLFSQHNTLQSYSYLQRASLKQEVVEVTEQKMLI